MAYVSCQRVISGRRVMRPKVLRKRDEVAGAEAEDGRESEAEGVPLTAVAAKGGPPPSKSSRDARFHGW